MNAISIAIKKFKKLPFPYKNYFFWIFFLSFVGLKLWPRKIVQNQKTNYRVPYFSRINAFDHCRAVAKFTWSGPFCNEIFLLFSKPKCFILVFKRKTILEIFVSNPLKLILILFVMYEGKCWDLILILIKPRNEIYIIYLCRAVQNADILIRQPPSFSGRFHS